MSVEEALYEVHLAIYDLSHGMARSLSSQFLGPNHSIDIVPHSGVVVYNREYFFGGGIQMQSPSQFRLSRGIQPVQIVNMGKTRVSQQQFERWCTTVATTDYSPTSYDLIHNNCNNFADFALRDGLLLNAGVPDWVLDVPRTFLSSPLGSMMRPILQNMQMTATPPVNGGTRLVAAPPAVRSTTEIKAIPATNPWATTTVTTKEAAVKTEATITIPLNKGTIGTPLLDSYNRPLLSSNDAVIPLCIKKLRQAVDQLPVFDHEDEKQQITTSLEQLELELLAKKPTVSTIAKSIYPLLCKGLQSTTAAAAGDHSSKRFAQKSSVVTYACMLLRLVVLHNPSNEDDDSHQQHSVTSCILLIAKEIVPSPTNGSVFISTASRSMAWCVLSNSFAHPTLLGSLIAVPAGHTSSTTELNMDQLVEAAIADIVPTKQSKEVRQAASAFLYNLTLHLSAASSTTSTATKASGGDNNNQDSATMPDVMVTLLCGVLEGVSEESDDTSKSARILVAALVVKVYSGMALQLMIDLGFVELLRSIQDGEISKALANELCNLLFVK